jgi:hypothetical protein
VTLARSAVAPFLIGMPVADHVPLACEPAVVGDELSRAIAPVPV